MRVQTVFDRDLAWGVHLAAPALKPCPGQWPRRGGVTCWEEGPTPHSPGCHQRTLKTANRRSGRQGCQERGLAAAPFWARAPATPAPSLCLGKSLRSPTSRGTRRSCLPPRGPCCTGPTSPPPAPTCARPAPSPRDCHVQHPGLLPLLHLSRCSGCKPRSVLWRVSRSDKQIHPRLMRRTHVRGP